MDATVIDPGLRAEFERRVVAGTQAASVEALARALKAGGAADDLQRELAAAFAHAAFAAPGRIADIYDAAAAGWFGAPVEGSAIAADAAALPPGEAFWRNYWDLVAAPALDAGEATSRTAALGAWLDPAFAASAARACLAFPGVARAAEAGFPDRTQLSDLAACPAGSLGEDFYRLIVDNDFDLEVLDRDALGLAGLTPPLDYLNARMLQTHDLWHILAGYRTTKLHEVAISGFQMAQFGHGYSAMFLALVATKASLNPGPFFAMMMDTILSAWVHGRRTPPMLLIPWEQVWRDSTDAIRARYGVAPYDSPYPADIFEQYEAGA